MSGLLLRAQEAAARILPRFDVTRAYVFGSQARGDATDESDLDLRIERGASLDFGDLDEIREEFSRQCGASVDVVCARNKDFDADFLAQIEREQVLVYAR